ncbi:hypothetical protein EYC80_001570 [Monilinia laxa]|uniref:Rhodopsin domain-containing protein n=1 Tax=Monilinia laxa TaxID=61186 RepID=A0A5N6K5B4_MONLA|nr:hypothetical protein EYC80_001570 [Monilinia laxa]
MTSVGPDINIGGRALAVIWSLNAISISIVIARCMTQRFISRQLGLSDALVIVSMCVVTSMACLITVQYHYGWGRHFIYLDPFNRTEALKYNTIGQSFGVMGSTFGRMSFIVLMLQLFGTSKLKRTALWALFWAQFILNVIVVITLYVQCQDIRALWDQSVITTCWPGSYQTKIGYAHTAWNGFTDLFLTFLPATMLWSLQINRRTKIGLVFLLSLSLLAFVGLIMKIVYLGVLADRGDYTYNTVPFFIWVQVESNLVVIASSVPLLRPFFLRLKSRVLHTRSTAPTVPTYELSGYSGKQKSMQKFENRGFSQISDEEEGGHDKEARAGSGKDDDGGSEDCILPVQGERGGERLERWVVKKEVSYSVKVEELGDEEINSGLELHRGRTREGDAEKGGRDKHAGLVPTRGSRGRMSALSVVSLA